MQTAQDTELIVYIVTAPHIYFLRLVTVIHARKSVRDRKKVTEGVCLDNAC